MTTSLITGANGGLGLEVARQLVAAGHRVWIGARDDARGQHAAETVGARFVQLDVTDDASVAAAAVTVGALDVLVNNAGISGGRIGASEATADHMRAVYETNVFGPVRDASSKAALNMLTIRYAAAFPKMRINSVDPGFTATDFNEHRGSQTVEEGAEAIVRYALIPPEGPTGGSSTVTAPKPGEPT
jgi:NAD(P)-dependent dehydrogenase (short-subunit alcohol dehydrogenase family)